jgi:ribosomal protein S13
MKEKKRENIPYLLQKIQKKNMITGLTKIIGTRFTHERELYRILGLPANKSRKIKNLTKVQRKNYVFTLNKFNFLYQDKDREEIESRAALSSMNIYRQWRYKHGLPCRGQRTKTNASTAHNRIVGRPTEKQIKKGILKSKKKFEQIYKNTPRLR